MAKPCLWELVPVIVLTCRLIDNSKPSTATRKQNTMRHLLLLTGIEFHHEQNIHSLLANFE